MRSFCRVVQTMVVCTCVCMYTFYICTYMCQLNPLMGPQLKKDTVFLGVSMNSSLTAP